MGDVAGPHPVTPAVTLRLAVTAALVACARPANAQDIDRWQPEAQIGALAGRTTAWHAGLGVNAVDGVYLRLGVMAAAGERRDGDTWRRSGRVDVIGRFHLDPFREYAHGLYAGGGASFAFDDGLPGRTRLVAVVGYEGGAAKRRWLPGIELGFGGGVRASLTFRRARSFGR